MSDYIRRDALREARNLAIRAYENANVFNADAIRKRLKPLLDAVVDTPAADVAEVVRCKDCKNFRRNEENDPYCADRRGLSDPEPDGFCNFGERRKE